MPLQIAGDPEELVTLEHRAVEQDQVLVQQVVDLKPKGVGGVEVRLVTPTVERIRGPEIHSFLILHLNCWGLLGLRIRVGLHVVEEVLLGTLEVDGGATHVTMEQGRPPLNT